MILASEISDKLTMGEYCAASLANLLGVTPQTIGKWRMFGRRVSEKESVYLKGEMRTDGNWVYKREDVIDFYTRWLEAVA